ncbi:hypothetical protein ASE30_00160 [Achromobacter sp. Root83]|uniref:hypothetical protein n=1 Tax=Achromobacter sp. Root83 TaxID=1736602 RepID=UPI00071043F9|nr:hypothetical protein [Achromobacter sp. Root83]KRC85431.1 hypothetical protein ASE30_00160 [Achromobacter sp. Root83]
MSNLSKKSAMELLANIRSAKITAQTIAGMVGECERLNMQNAGFLGGLESVLRHFLLQHGCNAEAAALQSAMNEEPSVEEMARHRKLFAPKG